MKGNNQLTVHAVVGEALKEPSEHNKTDADGVSEDSGLEKGRKQ